MRPFYIAVFLINFLVPSLVLSSGQGTLGTTSSGTVSVSITIPSLVQATGLSDIAFGSTSSFPATANTTACIYSNVSSPLGSYYVTANSLNTSGTDFRVNNSGTYITYSAYWNNTSTASQTTTLTSGTKTAQQTGGSASSLNCGGSANANFNINFSTAQVQGAPAGTYTDTATLLITPS